MAVLVGNWVLIVVCLVAVFDSSVDVVDNPVAVVDSCVAEIVAVAAAIVGWAAVIDTEADLVDNSKVYSFALAASCSVARLDMLVAFDTLKKGSVVEAYRLVLQLGTCAWVVGRFLLH